MGSCFKVPLESTITELKEESDRELTKIRGVGCDSASDNSVDKAGGTHIYAPRGRLNGKRALITGGANGIGVSIVKLFCKEGAKVVFVDIDEAGGRKLADETGALFLNCDCSKELQVKNACNAANDHFGGRGYNCLVNNAAVFQFGEVQNVTEAEWDHVLGVNVKGFAFMMKHSVPHLRKAGGGSIVNMGSISSYIAQPAFVPYSVTKAAILQLTKNTALDLGRFNIRVNMVAGGAIKTAATELHAKNQNMTLEELLNLFKPHLAIQRWGHTMDCAHAIAFLCSDESSYTTGSTLSVDGGWLAVGQEVPEQVDDGLPRIPPTPAVKL